MNDLDLIARYNEFQKDAVNAIVSDFSNDPKGRYLLVIPTGGGKTYTAVKSVCLLYENGILDKETDHILWIAHRTELVEQAEKTFKNIISEKSLEIKIGKQIQVEMVSSAEHILSNKNSIKLIVIDEAHHSAAKSYNSIFEQTRAGVLGLTATPSRHDGLPLNFTKESFSIGFPDLITKGIILRPNIVKVIGEKYEIIDIEDLEQLDNDIRNKKIIKSISDNKDKFKKIIIYVGTKDHAKHLYSLLNESKLVKDYKSISYITGKENSRNQSRDEFISNEKEFNRSILINVQVLSEGYDDPKINTVIMAAPSKSKLFYMQAMGRAVRLNPEDQNKKAHLVEVIDDLPNIRYRIDNRWLFSDISDLLEPAVIDYSFSNSDEFRKTLIEIYEKYTVSEEDRNFPEHNGNSRYSMLLFNNYIGSENFQHRAILIDNYNRQQVNNTFNFISAKMHKFSKSVTNYKAVFKSVSNHLIESRIAEGQYKAIYDSMNNAYVAIQELPNTSKYVSQGTPWVKFITINYRENDNEVDPDLLFFVEEMINKEIIIEKIKNHDYEKNDVLLRMPQPLSKSVGIFVKSTTANKIKAILENLKLIKTEEINEQFSEVNKLLSDTTLPIESKYSSSLIQIVRDEEDKYYFEMKT